MNENYSPTKKGRLTMIGGFFALVLAAIPAGAATIIPGGNLTNQSWIASKSPYIVAGDATVVEGATLTIEAGVEVQFAASDGQFSGFDQDKVELIIAGRLTVAGTSLSPVLFKAQSGNAPGVWFGIHALGSGFVDIDYARFNNATQALRTESNAFVNINEVVFTASSTADLFTVNTASPTISGSLSGSRVTGPLTVPNGFLTHSNSPGQFLMNGDLQLVSNARYHLRLDSPALFDSMLANSAVTLGSFLEIDATRLTAGLGDTFTILNKTSVGAITGTFNGLAEGAQFESSGFNFQISYAGGDGNDVVLSIVPEPSPSLLLLCVAAAFLAHFRRTKRIASP